MKSLLLVILTLHLSIIYCQSQIRILPQTQVLLESNRIKELEEKVRSLSTEIEQLNKSLSAGETRINIVLGALGIFLSLGAGISFTGFLRNEKRETKSFELGMDMYKESQISDKAIRERENLIFSESQKTLSLVNETLLLATDASKRASKSLEGRLLKSMEGLEKESRKIISKSRAFEDDKNLTKDTDTCSEIHRIGRKIEGLENNLVMLDENSVSVIKPYCNFIRGADSYLSEQFDEAIEYWEKVTMSNDADNEVKSLASFWIGYVYNNLGEFIFAINNFKTAQSYSVDSRKYELMRIQLETRFFNSDSPSTIIEEFDRLLSLIENDTSNESRLILSERKKKIQTTLGNVYYQCGNEIKKNEEKINCYKKSKEIFRDLLGINEEEDILAQIQSFDNLKKDREKWIIFGYAESLYQLSNDKTVSNEIFKKIIYYLAENEFLSREEKRTKVLAKTTQLICAIRNCEDTMIINNTKSQVESALSVVDKRLTIYSQLQRRNVKRENFREDLTKLLVIDKIKLP